MNLKTGFTLAALAAVSLTIATTSRAALTLDRTRVIVNGGVKSVTLNISNQSKDLAYLAQAWVEDEHGKKVQQPIVVTPPLQRLDAGKSGQLKVQTPSESALPQDRETIFYFNLREIPPKSDKPNTLQLALQTRVKMFYRPASLFAARDAKPWQEKLTLSLKGDQYQLENPTGYYVTIVEAGRREGDKSSQFSPVMVSPKSSISLGEGPAALGNAPVLTYINDYGGRITLQFTCSGQRCTVKGK